MYQLKINAYNITGKITDEKLAPIEFVNVVLLNSKDSSFVDGVVSDSEGRFSLPTHNRPDTTSILNSQCANTNRFTINLPSVTASY